MTTPRPNRTSRFLALCAAVGGLALVARACSHGGSTVVGFPQDNHPLTRTVDDPASADAGAVDLAGAKDFRFTMGDGSGMDGYDVVKIDPDGRCVYTFAVWGHTTMPDGTVARVHMWKRTEFTVDAATLGDLRKLLAEIDFFRLKKSYHANVYDGTQRWAKVEASGKRKGVYCDNHFPVAFQRLYVFVQDRVVKAHPAEVAAAKAIKLDSADREREYYD